MREPHFPRLADIARFSVRFSSGPDVVEYYAHRRTAQLLLAKFVLRFRIEVACSMAFVQLLSGITCGAIDHPASLNCASLGNHL